MRSCANEIGYMTQFVAGVPAGVRNLAMTTPGGSCYRTFPHAQMQEALLHKAAHLLGVEIRRGETVDVIMAQDRSQVRFGDDGKPLSAGSSCWPMGVTRGYARSSASR